MGGRLPAPISWRRRACPGLAAVLLVLQLLLAGCLGDGVAGPPLVILDTTPEDGGYLPYGDPVVLEFNFAVDPDELARRLTVTPPCQLEIRATGSTIEVYLIAATPGKAYRLAVAAGLVGSGGQSLNGDLQVAVVILPEGIDPPAMPEAPASGGTPGDWPVLGCRLELEGHAVAGCDLRGEYEVPRFDAIRLYWPPGTKQAERPLPALLAIETGHSFRELPVQPTEEPGFTRIAVEEQVRAGGEYLVVVRDRVAEPTGAPVTDLWRLRVRGSPYQQIWSVDLKTGKTTAVGQLDLGFEARMLLPGPGGGMYAVGTPGGLAWDGIEAIQPLGRDLAAAGRPVAVLREANVLQRQVDPSSGTLVAVTPLAGVPPLPDGLPWDGHLPARPASADPGPADPARRTGDGVEAGTPGTALIALGGDAVCTLMWGSERAGEFMSGPAMSPQRDAVSFAVSSFGENVTVGLHRIALPQSWDQGDSVAAEVFPVRVAHNTYEVAFTGGYLYSSGTAWAATGEIWWDICVDAESAEVWRVSPRETFRELLRSGAGVPLVSPDGRYALCRVPAGALLIGVETADTESVTGSFAGATWLPDNSGVLLVGPDGITLLPVDGRAVRIVPFAARPGLFVGPTEYWFVSDRRL